MRVAVSACLLGRRCRYDGGARPCAAVRRLATLVDAVPLCPEVTGGLPVPRPPAERVGGRVLTAAGADVTEQYARGAAEAVMLCKLMNCGAAVLKERSPSCGSGEVYDGTFSGVLTAGDGVTAAALKAAGIPVYGESEIDTLL